MSTTVLPIVPVTTLPDSAPLNYTVYAILGVQKGDESKGKQMPHYINDVDGKQAVMGIRVNGGANAGHTVYVSIDNPFLFITAQKREEYRQKGINTIKFATHQLPTSILFKYKDNENREMTSVIGFNCMIDLPKLAKELMEVAGQLGRTYEEMSDSLKIVPEAQLTLPEHVAEDKENDAVGTTGSGMGPGYAAKAYRRGRNSLDFYNKCVDGSVNNDPKCKSLLDAIHKSEQHAKNPITFVNNKVWGIEIVPWIVLFKLIKNGDKIIVEGAQGFWLDINLGPAPYTTSSDCTIGTPCSYGFVLEFIKVIGVSKAY